MLNRNSQLHAQYYSEAKTETGARHTSSGGPLAHQQSNVLCIRPIPDEARVVVLHEDGVMSLYSYDCVTEIAQTALREINNNIKVHTVGYMSAMAARSSILKSRVDLTLGMTEGTIVIPIVYEYTDPDSTASHNLHYAVWAWSLQPPSRAVQLFKHDLGIAAQHRNCEFDLKLTKRTCLLDLVRDGLEITIDVNKIVPSVIRKVKKFSSAASTYVDVTEDIRLYASQDDLQLYNRSFSSLLAVKEYSKQGEPKRDRITDLRLLAYFPHLKRAVGYTKNYLLSVDLLAASTFDFKQNSLLIGNVLRGSGARSSLGGDNATVSIGKTVKKASPNGWKSISTDLRALVDRHDITGFEDAFLTLVEHDAGREFLSGVPAEFVLSNMFVVSTTNIGEFGRGPTLELSFFAPRLLKWCIQHGFLTDQAVHRALSSQQQRPSWLPLGSVVNSLFQHDTSLDVLEHYVLYSPYIEPRILILLVRKLVSMILTSTSSRLSAIEDAPMADDDGHLVALSSSGPSLRNKAQNCLLHSLNLLSFAGGATVTRQFRDMLSQNDTLALIQLLRQQLFQGGFTRRPDSGLYPTPPASTNGEVNDSHPNMTSQLSLPSIIVLLNGCIDTIGPLGILDSGADATQTQFLERLVPDLLSEVQSAVEAVEESVDMQGMLRETLRYVRSVQKHEQNTGRDHSTLHTTRSVRRGQIRIVYTEPEGDEETGVQLTALPISLRARENLDPYKIRKGGGQVSRRSKRETGMLMDRTRSAYSFERLVF